MTARCPGYCPRPDADERVPQGAPVAGAGHASRASGAAARGGLEPWPGSPSKQILAPSRSPQSPYHRPGILQLRDDLRLDPLLWSGEPDLYAPADLARQTRLRKTFILRAPGDSLLTLGAHSRYAVEKWLDLPWGVR